MTGSEPWGIGTSKIDALFISDHQIERAYDPVWDGISTGIRELDHRLGGGLRRGDLTAFMGEHGVGKSELLVEVCRNVLRKGHRCLFISIEMQTKDILARFARMSSQREFSAISDNLLITDKCMINTTEIIELSSMAKPEAVFIDNLILIKHEHGSHLGDAALRLKDTAAQLNMTLACTIPLKPRSKGRKVPHPSDLSDLRTTVLNEYITDHGVIIHYDGSLTVDKTRWLKNHTYRKPWIVKDYRRHTGSSSVKEAADIRYAGFTQAAMGMVIGEEDLGEEED